ncbi:hypothetical protein KIW84_053444 [Lathyrus oleraceus]|uniref:Uncharacterized protein n=1 Tax=Pisum sativum TaxID=3888 RepID=A0A9D4WST1_PEA|nr:hypothetical protein KIW84_053444 [Pisum sativum]
MIAQRSALVFTWYCRRRVNRDGRRLKEDENRGCVAASRSENDEDSKSGFGFDHNSVLYLVLGGFRWWLGYDAEVCKNNGSGTLYLRITVCIGSAINDLLLSQVEEHGRTDFGCYNSGSYDETKEIIKMASASAASPSTITVVGSSVTGSKSRNNRKGHNVRFITTLNYFNGLQAQHNTVASLGVPVSSELAFAKKFEAWELTPITANPVLSDEMARTDLRDTEGSGCSIYEVDD